MVEIYQVVGNPNIEFLYDPSDGWLVRKLTTHDEHGESITRERLDRSPEENAAIVAHFRKTGAWVRAPLIPVYVPLTPMEDAW